MDLVFDCARYPTGDDTKDADDASAVLDFISKLMDSCPGIRKKATLVVSNKNARGHSNAKCLREYVRPDDETVKMLEESCDDWMKNPVKFWVPDFHSDYNDHPDYNTLNPQAQLVDWFIRRHRSDI